MDALANLLKHFIVRDIIYAIGGGTLIASFVYTFGSLPKELEALAKAPTVASLLLAGVAWAVGYAVSDGLGGIVPTFLGKYARYWPFVFPDAVTEPRKLVKRLYKGFLGEPWKNEIADVDRDEFRDAATALINKEFGSYHRTVLLRHLGTAIGGCGFLSSVFVIGPALRHHDPLALAFSVAGLVVSVLLMAIGWVKALNQSRDIYMEVQRIKAGTLERAIAPKQEQG